MPALTTTRPLAQAVHRGLQQTKPAGDISSVFPSLSGAKFVPLPPRFAEIKRQIIAGNERALQDSWDRLMKALEYRIAEVRQKGSSIIPSIEFSSLSTLTPETLSEIRQRGTVVIRNVLPASEALTLKAALKSHIAANPQVRAFPASNPSVYELYWTRPQVQARSHPNILTSQKFLQSLWHTPNATTKLSTTHTLTYADRLRIRPPGDAQFALGPHVDSGSVERWEDAGYRRAYAAILSGAWESHDAFDATHRVDANSDLHNAPGGCATFRMFQGWLSMSDTAPGEGGLRVNPMLKEATAYIMLRPFFTEAGRLERPVSPKIEGAVLAASLELKESTHPALALRDTMVPVPEVRPGDFVAWHCDSIHAVDSRHGGKGDSSVLYIPATPLCAVNARYLKRQREAARGWFVPPDFPGAGVLGEAGFVGRAEWEVLEGEGAKAMGMGSVGFEVTEEMGVGEREAVGEANRILFG